MELLGTVKKIGEIQTFASGFQKRELILMTQEQYPQPISIEFTQDKIALLDGVAPGDSVKIGINLRGREWTSPQGEVKYFNSITGWRIEKSAENSYQEPVHAAPTHTAPAASSNANPFEDEEDDDLPF